MNPRLDKVQERLEAALARIDTALVERKPDSEMADKLKIVTEEYVALRIQHREISNRLDAAIGRLRHVLEE